MSAVLLDVMGTRLALGEQAVAALPLSRGVALAGGDGVVRLMAPDGAELWRAQDVHAGALLTACVGPNETVLTGGDDGRVVEIDGVGQARERAKFPGKWIEAIAASSASGAVAAAVGKDAVLIGPDGPGHAFDHVTTVVGLAFEPNGRRLAATHRDGLTLSWASNPASRRKTLSWKGAHLAALWHPSAKFVLTTMQENALHGWRLQDGQHFRMTGYPAKVRSAAFSADGLWLVTAGAPEVVCWPFSGPNGPINQSGRVLAEMEAPVTAVACHPSRPIVAAGAANGEVGLFPLAGDAKPVLVAAESGAMITALSWDRIGGMLAFSDEAGAAGVVDFRAAL